MLEETFVLLNAWDPGRTTADLMRHTLENGALGSVTARRHRNIVHEMFHPRYLSTTPPSTPSAPTNPASATWLKPLAQDLPRSDFASLALLYTARANEIFHDFLTEVYWPSYAAGRLDLDTGSAKQFIIRGGEDGHIRPMWSESTVKRVSAYLLGCCADFGLLEPGRKSSRAITASTLSRSVSLYLAHELHFQGLSDNAVLQHRDWQLFGLEVSDVLEELKRLVREEHFLLQYSGDLLRISWKYQRMEEVLDAVLKR